MDNILNFFAVYFSNFIWLAVFILALLPITEGRIAFCFAINKGLLSNSAMTPLLALLTCFLASVFLTLFLLTFFNVICKFLSKFKVFNKIINNINKVIENKSKSFKNKNYKYLYLFLFVLFPLPLTGVWSGCLISEFLKLNFIKSFISIVLGNLCCLILIYFLNLVLKDFTLPLFIILFIILFLVIIIKKVKTRLAKKK